MLNVKENKIPVWNESVVLEEIAKADASKEVNVPYTDADHKLVLVVNNAGSADGTITVTPGEMPMSGNEELEISVPAGKTIACAFESGRFKKKDGNIHIVSSSTDLGFQLIAMP